MATNNTRHITAPELTLTLLSDRDLARELNYWREALRDVADESKYLVQVYAPKVAALRAEHARRAELTA